MLTRFAILSVALLAFPSSTRAVDLSAAQERFCVQMGSLAVTTGDLRDSRMSRSAALILAEQGRDRLPELHPLVAGMVFWVYEHPELRGSELYTSIVLACRQEIVERTLVAMQGQMRADMASICETMADIGAAIAGKTATLTQAQALARWRVADSDNAVRAAYVEKLVPFVYQRKRMTPVALRVAITQQCLNDLATELHTQFGGGIRR